MNELKSELQYEELSQTAEMECKSGKGVPSFRVGQGYDLHLLVAGRRLVLGGEEIPFEKGLLGHSDADVLLHAIADSLLGAAALGDIGKHFPDTDEKYKDANSKELLKNVVSLLDKNGYVISNIDSTIVAQNPKMSPYIEKMRQNIADTCNISIERVSVKATTTEKTGAEGNGEAISAQTVCLIFS